MCFCQPQILGDHEVIESLHTKFGCMDTQLSITGKFGVVWLMCRFEFWGHTLPGLNFKLLQVTSIR